MPSKRLTRRRGRAPHADDSDDDEIVRAAQTDSDESNDSLDESDSDSDSEPVSRHLTPNTSHSPDADEKPAPFFAATPSAWADLVDEQASLPVITFGELDAHAVRKVRMAEPEPVPAVEEEEDDQDAEQPVASSSRHSPAPPAPFVRRPSSHSARQAYQHRLESDPSFVPVVGEFWGHDDRLLDKDLRSLSGWWRGRWQGRGRGVFPPRGRGRGAFSGPQGQHPHPAPDTESAPESPLDRTWTHDGFEEMRRREDTRLRPPQSPLAARGGAVRGAPAFRARGAPPGRVPGRTWFVMKPEHMWTKQHDAFLYFDPALKARPGHPPGLRVRLPGGTATIVRAVPRPYRPAKPTQQAPAAENEFVVRLPRAGKERAAPPPPPPAAKPEPDAFVVKLRPTRAPSPGPASASPSAPAPDPTSAPVPAPANPLQPDADGWVRPDPNTLAAVSSPPAGPPPPLPPAFYPFAPPPGFAFPPPMPPPFSTHTPQPSFSTHTPQPSFSTHTPPPGFGTPPGAAFNAPLPALPPGVGLDPRGMPFELSSGRPVFLQAPVYGGFMHGHGHSHSMSHGHSMSMGQMPTPVPDPTLFAFARPARVEIRAPDGTVSPTASQPREREEGKAAKPKLRTGAAAFVPGPPSASASVSAQAQAPTQAEFFPAYPAADGGGGGGGGGYPAGAYVPTQYYYPYYPAPPQEQQQPVYY
ncbi:hypothetical protein FB451DRAFT_1161300 [Mycena latifolia]|nr:hypothetical protein FB451DRAFT_1161300 [Mycena latifolia]